MVDFPGACYPETPLPPCPPLRSPSALGWLHSGDDDVGRSLDVDLGRKEIWG